VCLILLAHRAHPRYRLVVAANRDEWFRRPTAPAAFWPEVPHVFAGRDLEAKGTWLGVTRTGRFAALTNYREAGGHRPDAPSRGTLVSDFLSSALAPDEYLSALRPEAGRFNGFSLLVADAESVRYFSNREGVVREVPAGVYGLSNHLLDAPWPKVRAGKARLAAHLNGSVSAERLLEVLDDTEAAPDDELPRTGVSLDWERQLSPLRILADGYGTRSSTVLLVSADGEINFLERSFDPSGAESGVVRENFRTAP
jgi:uncharacterized protein with NRDE domain